jgi:hypothetical protein
VKYPLVVAHGLRVRSISLPPRTEALGRAWPHLTMKTSALASRQDRSRLLGGAAIL